jgi:hypothetical protein
LVRGRFFFLWGHVYVFGALCMCVRGHVCVLGVMYMCYGSCICVMGHVYVLHTYTCPITHIHDP